MNVPTLSPELIHLWNVYVDIRSGADSISYEEIRAYCETEGPLELWEIRALRRIERERLKNG